MLPQFLSSSYRQYKQDTNAFATWLSLAAKACGVEVKAEKTEAAKASTQAAAAPSQRLKGKARQLAKAQGALPARDAPKDTQPRLKTSQYAVSTQQLLAQAEAIVSSASGAAIHMPESIQTLLERTISARQRCSAWFAGLREADGAVDRASDEGHQHFITVLQQILTKFADSKGQSSEAQEVKDTKLSRDALSLSNRFSHLSIEESAAEEDITPIEIARMVAKPAARNSKPPDTVDVFELAELGEIMDDAFAVFCFFEDLHVAREQLKHTWQDYHDGKINLPTATAITEIAFETVKAAEAELCFTLEGDMNWSRWGTHAELQHKMILGDWAQSGGKKELMELVDEKVGTVQLTPYDHFTFRPMTQTLFKFIRMKEVQGDAETRKSSSWFTWPISIPNLTFSYGPLYKDGAPDELERLEKNDMAISQLLIDMMIAENLAEQEDNKGDDNRWVRNNEVGDLFCRAMRPIVTGDKVDTLSVFAAQIIADTLSISDTFEFRLEERALRDVMLQQMPWDVATPLNWPAHAMQDVYDAREQFIIIDNPMLPKIKKQMLVEFLPEREFKPWDSESRETFGPLAEDKDFFEGIQRAMIDTNREPDFLATHNPLSSGTSSIKLLLTYESLGLSLANHHLTIFLSAHIYNALRQTKLLDISWPVMDRIMQLHTQALFAGDVPTNTVNFAHGLRVRIDYAKKNKHALQPHALGQALKTIQAEGRNGLVLAGKQLEAATNSTTTLTSTRRYTPGAFILAARQVVPGLMEDLTIDYIALTKQCSTLLSKFRLAWNGELVARGQMPKYVEAHYAHGNSEGGQDSNDLGVIPMVLDAMKEAGEARKTGHFTYEAGEGAVKASRGKKDGGVLSADRHGVGLAVAGRVFAEALQDGGLDTRLAVPDRRLKDIDARPPRNLAVGAGDNS